MSILVTFTDTSTAGNSGPITAWHWDFGDGATSTVQSPTHTYAAAGTYLVTLTIAGSGSDGSSSVTHAITVGGPSLAAAFTDSISGLAAAFTDTSIAGPSGPITAWAWDFDDSHTSSAQNPNHTYAAGGDYEVALTVTGTSPDGTAMASKTITVAQPVMTADLYAAPNGSDSTGTGTLANPFRTMAKLFRMLQPDQVGMLRGGTYSSIDPNHSPWHMYLSGTSNGSSAAHPVRVTNYPGEVVQILGPLRIANGWDGVQIVGNGGANFFKINGWPQIGTNFSEPAVWAYGNDFLIQDVDVMNNNPANPLANTSQASALFFGNPGSTRAFRPTVRRCRLHDVHWTGSGNQPHGCYCDFTDDALFEDLVIYNIIGAGTNQYALQIYPNAINTTIRQIMIYNCNGGIVIGTQASGQASDADVSNVVAHSVTTQPVVKTIIASGSTVSATLADCHTYNCPHGLTAAGSDVNLTDSGGHTTGDPLEANLAAAPKLFYPFGNPDAASKGPDWS